MPRSDLAWARIYITEWPVSILVMPWKLIQHGDILSGHVWKCIHIVCYLIYQRFAVISCFTRNDCLGRTYALMEPGRNRYALQWRHNGRDDVSNQRPLDCLLNRLFRHRSKKTSKLRVTGLCEGNSPVAGEFPSQMVSNTENVSIWWRHHGYYQHRADASTVWSIVMFLVDWYRFILPISFRALAVGQIIGKSYACPNANEATLPTEYG